MASTSSQWYLGGSLLIKDVVSGDELKWKLYVYIEQEKKISR